VLKANPSGSVGVNRYNRVNRNGFRAAGRNADEAGSSLPRCEKVELIAYTTITGSCPEWRKRPSWVLGDLYAIFSTMGATTVNRISLKLRGGFKHNEVNLWTVGQAIKIRPQVEYECSPRVDRCTLVIRWAKRSFWGIGCRGIAYSLRILVKETSPR
jgi:hypothetical protein